MKEKSLTRRWIRFWQGLFGIKMNQRELGRTDIVYHNAIGDRVKQHDELKSALGRLIILRNRAEKHIQTLTEDLQIVEKALSKSAQDGDEARGIELIGKRNQIHSALETGRIEISGFATQIASAKDGLQKLSESIVHLKGDQAKVEARRRHAQARIQAAEALDNHTTTNFDETALGRVRDAVEELEARAGLVEEPNTPSNEPLSIASLRKEQSDENAREEFKALQAKENGRLLVAPEIKSAMGLRLQEAHS